MAPRLRYPVPDFEQFLHPDNSIGHAGGKQFDDFEDFATRQVVFEYRQDEDDLWHYEGLLGSGAYGLVGLWQKRDPSTNQPIDEMAIKEAVMPSHDLYSVSSHRVAIPEEVIIQTALQKKNCAQVVQVRGLNIITAPWPSVGRIRYYIEYCPKGTLDDLMTKYGTAHEVNAQSDAFIPEPFLWQLLLGFAEVMVAMEQKPFDHPSANDYGDNPFILHFDIKTVNIFLGIPEDEDPIKGYPAVKVGDWGLARLTSLTDFRNSADWRRSGTRKWYPPEQFKRNTFGDDWPFPDMPPWRNYQGQNDYPYRTALSVFAFASVIFRLMKLDIEYNALEDLITLASMNSQDVLARGYRYIGPEHMDQNWFGHPTPYSAELKRMIADCLNLDPAQRPSPMIIQQLAHRQCTMLAARQFDNGRNTFEELRFQSAKHWREVNP